MSSLVNRKYRLWSVCSWPPQPILTYPQIPLLLSNQSSKNATQPNHKRNHQLNLPASRSRPSGAAQSAASQQSTVTYPLAGATCQIRCLLWYRKPCGMAAAASPRPPTFKIIFAEIMQDQNPPVVASMSKAASKPFSSCKFATCKAPAAA